MNFIVRIQPAGWVCFQPHKINNTLLTHSIQARLAMQSTTSSQCLQHYCWTVSSGGTMSAAGAAAAAADAGVSQLLLGGAT